jgi:beta-glucosidase
MRLALVIAGCANIGALAQRAELAYSPPKYPSPWADPTAEGWEAAYQQATAFVSELSLPEKVNLTTGVG